MNAIDVSGLVKRYGALTALHGVDLTLPQGCIVGLLGPNGAGKSTLIKALVGALRPTSGSIRVLGLDPLKDKAQLRQLIGYMPQSPALYGDLSARENLRFFGQAHQVQDLEQRIAEILEFTELSARADDQVYTFSGGMQKRVSLACALFHRPQLLLLDEPTAAVDPHLKQRSWVLFRELAEQGMTLFLSTHLMDEALLCDQVVVLREGRVLAVDTPQGLLQRGESHIMLCAEDATVAMTIASTPAALAQALHSYGFDERFHTLLIDADSLETILLKLVKE